jgi:hypothetical protein
VLGVLESEKGMAVRRVNPIAKALRQPKYKPRVVPDKKKPVPDRKRKHKGEQPDEKRGN